jgi:amino acid transporter
MQPQRESLTRVIGTVGLAAGIVNVMIGGGIFRVPALVAAALGPAAPVAYMICAIAMALIVTCIASAGRRVTLTGGPYAYVGTTLGPYAGFLSGVLLLMIGTLATAAVSSVMASSIGALVPALSGPLMQAVVLAAAYAFWTAINLRGVKTGVQINTIVTAAKLLPLLLLAAAGAFFMRAEHLQVTAWPPAGDIARMSLILVFAFAGIEVALIPSGEVREPERTVPRAIALAMIGVTALYILLQIVAQGILGPALAQSSVPLADAAGASLGGWARALLLAGASLSMFGHLGGMTLSIPRIVYALARDGFLPRALAVIDPVSRAPRSAIVVQSVVTLLFAITGSFERLAVLANVSALALYFGCALASWRLGQSPIVPALACAVIVWLFTGMTATEWLAFSACIAAASALYFLRSRLVPDTNS